MTEKKYSRNLGTGNGIELVYVRSTTEVTNIVESTDQPYQLKQNYPNPFSTSTTIEFRLGESNHVYLSVYDISGRWVTTLTDEHYAAGTYSAVWNGKLSDGQPAASGVYICKMQTGSHVETTKMKLER